MVSELGGFGASLVLSKVQVQPRLEDEPFVLFYLLHFNVVKNSLLRYAPKEVILEFCD